MSTHDPLVFAGLRKEEVRIMQWSSAEQKIVAEPPDEDPRGMGIEAILTSDLFGLRAALDLPTLEDLDEKRTLQGMKKRSPKQEKRLQDLTKSLGELDFTRGSSDPLYPLFVEAMSAAQAEEGLLIPTLTPSQQDRQRELATEIVQRLKGSKGEKR